MDSADSESGSARGRHGAITGLGAVTPIGVGIDAFREALRAGRSGVRLHGIEHPMLRGTVAAPCDGFDASSVLERADLERLPRLVPMALAAAREAMAHAGLDASGDDRARRVGLILGTGAGGIDFTLDQAGLAYSDRRPSLWTITNATHGNLAGELSIALGLRGPSWCVSTGCGSSSDAIGQGLMLIRSGMCDRVVVC
ncbi:MAG: beta-ketoacyl synthase N-terminal-like domain-containing protein, partial [Planctomycetota bacterium]